MAEAFFDQLISCIRQDLIRHPGQGFAPDVLETFLAAGPGEGETGRQPGLASRQGSAAPSPRGDDERAAPGEARGTRINRSVPMEYNRPQPVPERSRSGATSGGNPPGSFPFPHPAAAESQVQIAPPPPTLDAATLDELRPIVLSCSRCGLAPTRTNVVFGEGDPDARLMFIGEGPGYDEDMQGRPFVGKAGQLLNKMITAMQFTREEVFIANVVKCRPPGNRVPSPDEAVACMPYLKKQIELVRPEVIVLLGATAVNFLLGRREGITRLRGKWLGFEGIPVMPTFHPAYLLRQESAKRDAWADLQQVMKVFGKAHPGR